MTRSLLNATAITIAACILILVAPAYANERLFLVTNNAELEPMSKWQLRQIYLENGVNHVVKPLNLPVGTLERATFNSSVIGLTESRLRSYWTQRKFTGRGTPPREFQSVEALLAFMRTNVGYVAYIPEEKIGELGTLKVVFSISYVNSSSKKNSK